MGERVELSKPIPRLRLRVTAAAEKTLRSGHPWLFADSILEQNRAGQLGELGVIYDRKRNFLAVGLFDPTSPIRLRVLQTRKAMAIDRSWWWPRLNLSLERRNRLFAHATAPSSSSDSAYASSFEDKTTGYRCVHGESDGWPGLVLDRYHTTLVLKLYTAAWLPRLSELVSVITEHLLPERLVLRFSRNIQELAIRQFSNFDGQILTGPPVKAPVVFRESGIQFEADVLRGQKTGFFLDQRENRRRVETLSLGRDVLNAFSFSGAFSLYAARGGARSVLDLDISSHALQASRRNFSLNQSHRAIAGCLHELIQADAFDWLEQNHPRQFDLIILDPPSLAKRECERSRALSAYESLALSGIKHLRSNGILVACSCSAHVAEQEFHRAVRQAGQKSGRKFEVVAKTGHPPDHPANFKEARYLKAIYLKCTSH